MGDTAGFWQSPIVYQKAGTTTGWTLAVGDTDTFVGYSVQPWSANSRVQVHSIAAWSDNPGNHYADFSVEAHSTYANDVDNPPDSGAVGLRFTAIKIPG